MELRAYEHFNMDEVMALYSAVGWKNYTDHPDMLEAAYSHSLCAVGAYDGDRLIGMIRAVGDGCSVVLIQDLLVLPEHQHKRVGTALIQSILNRYADAYQIQLLTDDTERTTAFYRSVGFVPAGDFKCLAFLKMRR